MRNLKRETLVFGIGPVMVALMLAATGTGATPRDGMNTTENDPLIRQAVEDLARRESVSPSDIAVESFEEVVWPDTSMGCPHPGMRYRQVPQDGARITLRVERGLREYHSGGNGAPFLCQQVSEIYDP